MSRKLTLEELNRVKESIEAKEQFEIGLTQACNANDSFAQRIKSKLVPSIDYQSHFATKFLARISPTLKDSLEAKINQSTINPAELGNLRQRNPNIDTLFNLLQKHFFSEFQKGKLEPIHGDPAPDNFMTINDELHPGDRELMYLQGKPQFSLWTLLGNLIPNSELRKENQDQLLAFSFEERYGKITPQNQSEFELKDYCLSVVIFSNVFVSISILS